MTDSSAEAQAACRALTHCSRKTPVTEGTWRVVKPSKYPRPGLSSAHTNFFFKVNDYGVPEGWVFIRDISLAATPVL